MLRNVVTGRLRTPVDEAQARADRDLLERTLAATAALPFDGRLSMQTGLDLGLREGSWSFALTNEWTDETAYRAYDQDPEHNRLRSEGIAPICEQVARVQFEVSDTP